MCKHDNVHLGAVQIDEFNKMWNGDEWKQNSVQVKKILIKLQNKLNDKWNRSAMVLTRLNFKMSKIHDAKEGKFFTVAQENRLRILRKRCVRIGYYRYSLIATIKKCGLDKPMST